MSYKKIEWVPVTWEGHEGCTIKDRKKFLFIHKAEYDLWKQFGKDLKEQENNLLMFGK